MIANLNWIDWVILIVILFFGIWGLKQGFMQGLIGLIIWLVAGVLAYFFTPDLSAYISKWIEAPEVRFYVAFFAIMLGVWIAGGILTILLTAFTKKNTFSFSDRLFGVVLGLAKGFFIASIAVSLLSISHRVNSKEVWQNSQLRPVMLSASSWMESILPKDIHNLLFQEKQKETVGKTKI
ncbi:CvpA family protein [Francisellaceae bacterium]|nr:CvpA family protein [Francisellaceae bacterium]